MSPSKPLLVAVAALIVSGGIALNTMRDTITPTASAAAPEASVSLGAAATAGLLPEVATPVAPRRVLDTRERPGIRVAGGQQTVVPVPEAAAAGATSVVLNLTATEAVADGWAKAWPCGEAMPPTSSLNFTPGHTAANAVVVKLPATGVCLTTNVPVHLIVDVSGWFTSATDFTGSSPHRLVDTRITGNPMVRGVERRIKVAGTPGVAPNASIAAMNITVDHSALAGWVAAYPCGQPTNGSTVNFNSQEDVANFTVVGLSGGDVCLKSNVDPHIIIDTYGWSNGAGDVNVKSPSRILDSREPGSTGPVESRSTIQLQVAGRGGVPLDAKAAFVTVTIADPQGEGFVTVWPCDEPFPTASTINTWPSALRSNLAYVKLSQTAGTACFRYVAANGTPTSLVVDAVGWTDGGPSRNAPSGPPWVILPPGSSGNVLWSETFNTPQSMDRLVKEVHDGAGPFASWNTPEHWLGDHDMGCAGPPTLRDIDSGVKSNGQPANDITDTLDKQIYYCAPGGDPAKGHMMTSMLTGNYITIAFAPSDDGTSAKVFPDSMSRVCWDQNVTNLGSRKWVQLLILPEATYNADRRIAAYINPQFASNGGPDGHVVDTSTAFLFVDVQNSLDVMSPMGRSTNFTGDQSVSDKAARFQHCVQDNGNGTVTVTQKTPANNFVRTVPGRFPVGPKVVVFQDETYNSPKAETPAIVADFHTWHWDNISIAG